MNFDDNLNRNNRDSLVFGVPGSWCPMGIELGLQPRDIECRLASCRSRIPLYKMYCGTHECSRHLCYCARLDGDIYCGKHKTQR